MVYLLASYSKTRKCSTRRLQNGFYSVFFFRCASARSVQSAATAHTSGPFPNHPEGYTNDRPPTAGNPLIIHGPPARRLAPAPLLNRPPPRRKWLDAPVLVPAGEKASFNCTYDLTGPLGRKITHGFAGSHEMCIAYLAVAVPESNGAIYFNDRSLASHGNYGPGGCWIQGGE